MYTKVKEDLYVVSVNVEKEESVVAQESATHRFYIMDGSGSTYGFSDRLKADVAQQVQLHSEKDIISIGYFSSKNDFGWICKGTSPSKASQLVKDFQMPYNMTCFSDILNDLDNVIRDFSKITDYNTLAFFSDGMVNQDQSTINALIQKVAPKLGMSIWVGYGDYYDRQQMSSMAKTAGGILVHSSSLADFSYHLRSFNESAAFVDDKIEFSVPKDAIDLVAISDNGDVVSFDPADKVIYLNSNTDKVAYTTAKRPAGVPALLTSELYALSRASLQNGNYGQALELLGVLGDVKFIDQVNNAFTIGEYGLVENELLEAVADETVRFQKGKALNYVPAADAPCALDVLEVLMEDEQLEFLPYHPKFNPKTIGRQVPTKEGYPKFEYDKNISVKMSSLTWSSDKLNLSVLARIPGTIKLDKNAKKVGLTETFNTYIWRNKAIIADGKLNADTIVLKNPSKDTVEYLKGIGVYQPEEDLVIVELHKLPVINRAIAQGYKDLDTICALLLKETTLKFENKTYGALYKALPEELQEQIDNLVRPTPFTNEQIAYLAKFGVQKDGSFAPPKEDNHVYTDEYDVNTIQFGVKGFSSIPSIVDVEKKLAANKPFTTTQALVAKAIEKFNDECGESEKQQALWLKEKVLANRNELKRIRNEVNRAKFAVVLGKGSFEQLPKLDKHNDHEYNGHLFTLDIGQETIKI